MKAFKALVAATLICHSGVALADVCSVWVKLSEVTVRSDTNPKSYWVKPATSWTIAGCSETINNGWMFWNSDEPAAKEYFAVSLASKTADREVQICITTCEARQIRYFAAR